MKRSVWLWMLAGVFLGANIGWPEEPWASGDAFPVFAAVTPSRHTPSSTGFGETGCRIWLHIYQDGFSRFLRSKCPMIPSCSNYALEAIDKAGVFQGVLMTADRLYHEGRVAQNAPTWQGATRILFLDPVDDNQLWKRYAR